MADSQASLEEIRQMLGALSAEQKKELFESAVEESAQTEIPQEERAVRREAENKKRMAELRRAKGEAARQQKVHRSAAAASASPRQRQIEREKARLYGLEVKLADREMKLIADWRELLKNKEKYWEWHDKIAQLIASAEANRDVTDKADQTMPVLIETLTRMRELLGRELAKLHAADGQRAVFLDHGGRSVDRALFGPMQAEIGANYRALLAKEKQFRAELIQELVTLITALRQKRLALMDRVSGDYRRALVGFGPQGVTQAGQELRQIAMDFRYRYLTARLILEKKRDQVSAAPLVIVFDVLKLLLIVVVFRLWRKNADRILADLSDESPARKANRFFTGFFGFVRVVRKPIEWLLLITVLFRMIGEDENFHLLGYVRIILFWALVGWGLVLALHALASRYDASTVRGQLIQKARRKTFELLGVLFVVVQALLAATELAVGQGTLHTWVVRGGSLMLIPVFFIVVHWWKSALVEWLGDGAELSGFLKWVHGHQNGLVGFISIIAGVVYMITGDAVDWMIATVGDQESARRILAYRTRSGIEKRGRSGSVHMAKPLPDEKVNELLAEVEGKTFLIEEFGEKELAELNSVVEQEEKTVCAVIGDRGAGKTVLVNRLIEGAELESLVIQCGPEWHRHARRRLAEALEVEQKEDDVAVARALGKYRLVVFENAHMMVLPAIGGRDVLDWLRSVILLPESGPIAVVMTFNSAAWRFVFRSYRNQSMFDSTVQLPRFSDAQIARLIDSNIEAAGLDLSYKYLETVHAAEDTETARTERAKIDFARVLWDYSAGNPKVALYWWRKSLYTHRDTGKLIVQLFESPRPESLEKMDLSTQFMIITLIKLGIARSLEIAECNNIEPIQAEQVLRKLKRQGILEVFGNRYQVTLHWYRAVVIALKRKFPEVE